MKAKKYLGQNFLIDKNLQEKIVNSCNLQESDIVLEIGPGRGEITQLLLAKAKRVIAVEIDRELCKILDEKFKEYSNFELRNADILKTALPKQKNLKVIANIPYYISTPIIAFLLHHRAIFKVIYLTLQKELAKRLIACPGSKAYGAFSCFVQFYTQPEILFPIKNSSFSPRPKVDSCFLRLKILYPPKQKVRNEKLLFRIIRLAFSQRRKLLKNNLSKITPESKVLHYLKACGLPANVRAENISLSHFIQLADYFSGKGAQAESF